MLQFSQRYQHLFDFCLQRWWALEEDGMKKDGQCSGPTQQQSLLFILEKLNSWQITQKLGERIIKTEERGKILNMCWLWILITELSAQSTGWERNVGRKSSVNVTDDTTLLVGNAQLDCVHTTQSKSRCSRHQAILINGEIWSLNYLFPPAMLIKWTGSLPDLYFSQWSVDTTFWVRHFQEQDLSCKSSRS